MTRKLLAVLWLLAPVSLISADSQWALDKSTLTYHVSHPLHQSEGVSHAARGKGVCQSGQCDFLIAAPVKSFDSGDSNRDLHMLQVTRGAQFPLVTVRGQLPESALAQPAIHADLAVQFAGETARFRGVVFQLASEGDEVRVTGTVPATLADFKIDPPSLLAIPVKNEIPIRVDAVFRRKP